jgi:3-oxoacyl-[acyl-carrier protein] reductase
VLLNNAGTHANGPFEAATDEIWQQDFDLKLFSAIRLARAALPGMKARKWGRIVNVLNTGAKWPRHGSAPTSVTRAAGMALTKVLANEGAGYNVLVNAVLVGLIQTDQWIRGHAKENKGRTLEDYLAEMATRIPIGRVGTAEEFANMILFLTSDAGSYVTGTAINVDGGMCPVVGPVSARRAFVNNWPRRRSPLPHNASSAPASTLFGRRWGTKLSSL